MSLAVVFKGPEGIAMAADSRATMQTLEGEAHPQGPTGPTIHQVVPSYFDNAQKILTLNSQPFVGIATFGAATIGEGTDPRTAYGFMPEFEAHLMKEHPTDGPGKCARMTTAEIASALGAFFMDRWTDAGMPNPVPPEMTELVFAVAGYDDGEPYGHVYQLHVPGHPQPEEHLTGQFGIDIGGQGYMIQRILGGFAPRCGPIAKDTLSLNDDQVQRLEAAWMEELPLHIPYNFLPLQDGVDMAEFLVRMTGLIQGWTFGLRGVGGPVDVVTITRTGGLQPIRQKKVELWDY